MPEVYSNPPVRIHRVTTRRRNLRALQCPLEPELLVAEFAGELPPDVTLAVREHIAVCETCGNRSRTLRAPYELLASLGTEPVATVPDLRDSVRAHLASNRFTTSLLRAASGLSRGSLIGVSSSLGLALIAAFLLAGSLVNANAHGVSRSSNALNNVPAASSVGTLLAETDKLVTVRDASGHTWQVAEVIAVSQHTGAVVHSLPSSSDSLQSASSAQMPVALCVSPDGRTVYEITAPDASHQQALVAFDASTGALRYAVTLKYPSGKALLADNLADALVVAPGGSTLYVGLNNAAPTTYGEIRILAVDAATGATTYEYYPGTDATLPMPPPPGSLPASAFPSSVPKLKTSGYTASVGANGAVAVSPDGKWLFDVLILSDSRGPQYAVVRRINALTGALMQELAIPGDFTLAQLVANTPAALAYSQAQATAAAYAQATATAQPGSVASATPIVPLATPALATPQLYLVRGSPEAQVFVLDPSTSGPTLTGTISLGGPAAPPNTSFTGTLSVSASADGTHLYITQNASSEQGQVTGHDFWELDVSGMSVLSHRVDTDAADAVQANTMPSGATFILRDGNVLLINSDLSGSSVNWLSLNNGHVVAFLGPTP